MITPLRKQLVSLLLENIHADRTGTAPSASTEVICGVIQSFVRVEEYKMKGQVDLYQEIFETPSSKLAENFI